MHAQAYMYASFDNAFMRTPLCTQSTYKLKHTEVLHILVTLP